LKPEPANSLALVPVTEYSAEDQNILAFADMFEHNTASTSNHSLTNSYNSSTSNPSIPASQTYPSLVQPNMAQHPSGYSNGATSNAIVFWSTIPTEFNWFMECATGLWSESPKAGSISWYHTSLPVLANC
jgi:hypothetical protein